MVFFATFGTVVVIGGIAVLVAIRSRYQRQNHSVTQDNLEEEAGALAGIGGQDWIIPSSSSTQSNDAAISPASR